MQSSSSSRERGFTFVELLITVSILLIVLVLSLLAIGTFRQSSDLETESQNILNTLRLAQSRTVASENATRYGVHFELGSFTLFTGSSYSPTSTSNDVNTLPLSLEISSWNLTGGGSDVVFDRVTGATSQDGTITLRVKGDVSRSRIIKADPSGEVSIFTNPLSQTGILATDTRHVHYDLGWNIASSTNLILDFDDIPTTSQTIVMSNYFNVARTKFDWSGTVSVNGANQTLKIHSHLMSATTTPYTRLSVHRPLDRNTKGVSITIVDLGTNKRITTYNASGTITLGPFGGTMSAQ